MLRLKAGAAVTAREKLDGGFDALTARTREQDFLQPAVGSGAKSFSQLSRELGNMALQHGRTIAIQFVMEGFYNPQL